MTRVRIDPEYAILSIPRGPIRRTGPVSYRTTSTGVHYAYAPIAAVISHDGVRQHVRQQIVLIREDGRWRFTTTRSGRRP